MSNVPQQASFFEFPQPGTNLSQMAYGHLNSTCLPSPQQSSSYQLCELIYTPVPTPTGMALTPSLVPISSRDCQVYGHPVPSPVPSSQASFIQQQALVKREESNVKAYGAHKSNASIINGIPAEQWKSMTDKERDDFLKLKRHEEAFKTALCQGFMKFGECKFGNTCRFAHGREELRLPKYNHPKYKTVLCRTYAVTGECPYGSRCQFIHEKYQGAIPEDYVFSVENTQAKKPKRKLKTFKSVQFSEDDKEKLSELHGGKSRNEVREAKRKLQVNNEMNILSDLTETFDKMFDAKKFFSHSCKPRLGI